MAIWLVRAGSSGEYETKFLEDGKIYLTWDGFNLDLSDIKSRTELTKNLSSTYPDAKKNTVKNWNSQIWQFVKEIVPGDWVVLPSKKKASIHIGEIKGGYVANPKGPDPFFHYRDIKWFATDIPRNNFAQDLLYSFGAFKTICQISRHDAEMRIKAMKNNNWQAKTSATIKTKIDSEGDEQIDLEEYARDQIAKYIIRKFKGHGMARLVEAILQAQGYTTYRSMEGPDKGVDILAAPAPMGFGKPRLCIQVKTGDTPVDRPTLDQLIGAIQNFKADQGLLVSWSGFKQSVDKEIPSQFFNVRLWDQNSIIQELLENYEKLDDEIRAELPLKRIWTLAVSQEE